METMKKSTSLISRLNGGEKVICTECRKGIYRPFNPKSKINHSYICDNCGAHVQWEPAVEVE